MPFVKQLRLRRSPHGMVSPDDVDMVEVPLPDLGLGDVLVAVRYLSVDPAIRVYMDPKSVIGRNEGLFSRVGLHVGHPLRTWIAGEVIESRSAAFPVGSFVRELHGRAEVQEYCVLPESTVALIDPKRAPLAAYIGALGMPGVTAYAGLIDVGQLQRDETVVVSAAAGGVGGVVGQIAKAKGCRVVGIAGGTDKCRYVTQDLGYTACINYRAGELEPALRHHCPDGIHLYFDNVGGQITDACMGMLADHGRIVICGVMTAYAGVPSPFYNYFNLLARRARIEAFNYYDVIADPDRLARIERDLMAMFDAGLLTHQAHVLEGVENFIPALHEIYNGNTYGKTMIKL